MKIKLDLLNILQEKKISILELSKLTEIRYATLHSICNNKHNGVNLKYLDEICLTLDIDDMNELFIIE